MNDDLISLMDTDKIKIISRLIKDCDVELSKLRPDDWKKPEEIEARYYGAIRLLFVPEENIER